MYLVECINSVLKQTYPNIEIVVVDDGSTDKSVEVLKKYGNNIKLLIHDKNYGYQKTINTAIKESSGEYLMVLDSDDVLKRGCVEILMERIKKEKCDAAYPQLKYVYKWIHNTIHNTICNVLKPFPFNNIENIGNHLTNCANMMLFSRSCLKCMQLSPNQWRDEQYDSQGDVEWILRFVRCGFKLCHVKKILYLRRKHFNKSWKGGSVSTLNEIINKELKLREAEKKIE